MILKIVFLIGLIELVIVSVVDYKTQLISNRWPILNFVASVMLYIFAKSTFTLDGEVLIFPLGVVVVGFFLYLLNIMGAGDSKFLASLFLLLPLEFHLFFLTKVVLSTTVVGSTIIMIKIIRDRSKYKAFLLSQYWEGFLINLRSRFSYAPVILFAWILLGFDIWN